MPKILPAGSRSGCCPRPPWNETGGQWVAKLEKTSQFFIKSADLLLIKVTRLRVELKSKDCPQSRTDRREPNQEARRLHRFSGISIANPKGACAVARRARVRCQRLLVPGGGISPHFVARRASEPWVFFKIDLARPSGGGNGDTTLQGLEAPGNHRAPSG